MTSLGDQRRFWNKEASRARFSHPLNRGWLEQVVQSNSAILDYGCGYGRTIETLLEMGFRDVTGLDVSQGMLDRAQSKIAGVRLVLADGVPSPFEDASFDLVILFAVLTRYARKTEQQRDPDRGYVPTASTQRPPVCVGSPSANRRTPSGAV